MKRKFNEINSDEDDLSSPKRQKVDHQFPDFEDFVPIPNLYHYRLAWKIMYQELEIYNIPGPIVDICAEFLHLDDDLVIEHNEIAKEKRVFEEHERDGCCNHGDKPTHMFSVDKCVERYYDDSYFCMFCYKYIFSDVGGENYAGCGGCMGFFCYDCLSKCKGFNEILKDDPLFDFTDKCPVCCS
jgi:hypothetical protein